SARRTPCRCSPTSSVTWSTAGCTSGARSPGASATSSAGSTTRWPRSATRTAGVPPPPRCRSWVTWPRASTAPPRRNGRGSILARPARSCALRSRASTSGPDQRSPTRLGRLGSLMGILDKVLRAGEGKKLKAIGGLVPHVNALEPELEALSDDELQGMTAEFRNRLDNGETLDDLLIEAFAVTREAAR